jgi:uncharacterized MnhB-related membrane protein
MTGILEIMMVAALIVLAFLTVQTIRQRRAVIYLGGFSLIVSFAYLAYNAPDVAIAEAVIGCTLSTVLFLIAIKKYRVITIYYVQDEEDVTSSIKKERRELTHSLENFLLERGYEPHVVSTGCEDRKLGIHDFIIRHDRNNIGIYSAGFHYMSIQMQEYLEEHKPPHLDVSLHLTDTGACTPKQEEARHET